MMSRIKWWLFLAMDHACDLTGHRVFRCWNGPGQRLWIWANDLLIDEQMIDQGFKLESEPRDEVARD